MREPLSYKDLPKDVMDIVLEACHEFKVGPKDLIDDPVFWRSEQSPEHDQARVACIIKIAKIPHIIRGEPARKSRYTPRELALFFDRPLPVIKRILRTGEISNEPSDEIGSEGD